MFTVYSMPNCSGCETAKQLLDAAGLEYEELLINLDFLPAELWERAGQPIRSLPQVFRKDERIGGVNELRDYLTVGKK